MKELCNTTGVMLTGLRPVTKTLSKTSETGLFGFLTLDNELY